MLILDKAWIEFHVNEEGKDSDTFVTVQYWSTKKKLVAQVENYFPGFSEGNDYGPYVVEIINDNVNKDDISNGKVDIRIVPKGKDTWKFNLSTIFKFKDGSTFTKFTSVISGIELSEDNPFISYDFADHNITWYPIRDFKADWMASDPYIKEEVPARELRTGAYTIECAFSGKPLDVINSSKDAGANIIQGGCGQFSQLFYIEMCDNGTCYIQNLNSSLYLDVLLGSTDEGAPIQQWPENDAANQRFKIVSMGYASRIINVNSGLALTVDGWSTDPGVQIRQYTFQGGDIQRFKFYWCTTILQ